MIDRVRESRNPKKVIRVSLMGSYGEIGRVPVNLYSITNYFKEHRGPHTDCKPFLDMNNTPFVIDSVFISLSLIKGAYHACRGCSFFICLIHDGSALQTSGYPAPPG